MKIKFSHISSNSHRWYASFGPHFPVHFILPLRSILCRRDFLTWVLSTDSLVTGAECTAAMNTTNRARCNLGFICNQKIFNKVISDNVIHNDKRPLQAPACKWSKEHQKIWKDWPQPWQGGWMDGRILVKIRPATRALTVVWLSLATGPNLLLFQWVHFLPI